MNSWLDFQGPNAGYIAELYERYRRDPQSVDPAARELFEHWAPPDEPTTAAQGQPAASDLAHIVGAVNLAHAIRGFGHLAARLDPLGSTPPGDPALLPATHGLTPDDLRRLPASLIGPPVSRQAGNAWDAIQALQRIYSATIGYDYDHIRVPEERAWLRHAAETGRFRPPQAAIDELAVLRLLTRVETFERFLHRVFPGRTRFSVGGARHARAHPGRNHQPCRPRRPAGGPDGHGPSRPAERAGPHPQQALQPDPGRVQRPGQRPPPGGARRRPGLDRRRQVSQGGQRVRQRRRAQRDWSSPWRPTPATWSRSTRWSRAWRAPPAHAWPSAARRVFDAGRTLPMLIHGDAAFPGQGVVAETLNLSRLPGWRTGGTIHIIANNQLGFTTPPDEGRSTLYASDLAKGFEIPIVHVNADDPAACMEVARLAYAYRNRFQKDFLIDLIGYRRYGHNEGDEPAFTQPLAYRAIDAAPQRARTAGRPRSSSAAPSRPAGPTA